MKKSRLVLIILSVLILLGCIGTTVFLLLSNYQNVRLFKQAQRNFILGSDESLKLAESQLLQVIRNDSDNEAAFVILGEIAGKRKIYPEQVYYRYMAYRLNPLSSGNKEKYIESLCFARYFIRLETLLSQEDSLNDKNNQLLIYAAGRNGSINKYKQLLTRRNIDNGIGELARLLFIHTKLTDEQKLSALKRFSASSDAFLRQESLVAETDLSLAVNDIDRAEKSLYQAHELNRYAFAPALGRFYAEYRNLGKALKVFEQHLAVYHDQSVALQAAEIYCLLNQPSKIEELRNHYQGDSGKRAMISCYYFDALAAFARKETENLKELTTPLRENIDTPLSAFIFFFTDIHTGDLSDISNSYNALLAHRSYLDLQKQADNILSGYLKRHFSQKRAEHEKLIPLATLLYKRKPDVFTAKLILLAQKRTNSVNVVLLKDAVSRFGKDQGIVKIAIEYYLAHELTEAEKLIADYKRKFAQRSGDMLKYEIVLNMQKKNYDAVSELFRKNFAPDILPEYWTFASTTKREIDLLFLSRDKHYAPFCRTLLLIKQGKTSQACTLLENSDAKSDPDLLFFAAKTLAENGRNKAALKKYSEFPKESFYKITVLLNMSELCAEESEYEQALLLAEKAYKQAPQMPETQLCYADKLHKTGKLSVIPDIVKFPASKSYRSRMKKLWISGMEQRIKNCNINTQREKIRELCRQLLVTAPDNNVALEYLKKLHQMPQ